VGGEIEGVRVRQGLERGLLCSRIEQQDVGLLSRSSSPGEVKDVFVAWAAEVFDAEVMCTGRGCEPCAARLGRLRGFVVIWLCSQLSRHCWDGISYTFDTAKTSPWRVIVRYPVAYMQTELCFLVRLDAAFNHPGGHDMQPDLSYARMNRGRTMRTRVKEIYKEDRSSISHGWVFVTVQVALPVKVSRRSPGVSYRSGWAPPSRSQGPGTCRGPPLQNISGSGTVSPALTLMLDVKDHEPASLFQVWMNNEGGILPRDGQILCPIPR
jgi:hypothetical protein